MLVFLVHTLRHIFHIRFTGLCRRNDSSALDKGIGKGRFSVVNVGNDGHVTDVRRLVHQRPDLVDREVNHCGGVERKT